MFIEVLLVRILLNIHDITTITFQTIQLPAEVSLPPMFRGYPETELPGRIMAHMLIMATAKFGDPVPFFIKAVIDNRAQHRAQSVSKIIVLQG